MNPRAIVRTPACFGKSRRYGAATSIDNKRSKEYQRVYSARMRALNWLNQLLDFCYPPNCAACGQMASALLCDECDGALTELTQAPACGWCAAPLGEGAACPFCQGQGLRPLQRVVALGRFDDPLKGLIHQVKYHHRWTLAEALADRLVQSETVKGLLTEADCLVPVPLYRWRQVARGYNQAAVVARHLGRRCRIRTAEPAIRWRHTETQTHLHSRARRHANLRDAFVLVSPRSIRGRHVVLVDDVMTTGATLQALARTLMAGEPASICAIVLAVADPRRRDFTRV